MVQARTLSDADADASADIDMAPAAPAGPRTKRVVAIDALRGLALFGVLAVNLTTEFRVSLFAQFTAVVPPASTLDRWAAAFVSLGLEAKAICLFSLLFGMGLAIQFDAFAKTGRPHYWLGRRLSILLGFGLLHLLFVWNGDILTEYAVAGLVLLPIIGARARTLATAAGGLLLLYAASTVLPPVVAFPDNAQLQAHVALANELLPNGTFFAIWRFNVAELPLLLPLHVHIFPRTLALFLLGAAMWRSGLVRRALADGFPTTAVAALLVLAAASLRVVEWATESGTGVLREALAELSPILLALGYAGAVFALARIPRTLRVLAWFAPLGRMALSNYVAQSLLFGWLFFGYGLGWHGKPGVATTLAMGAGVYLLQVASSAAWLVRFRHGPVEWLWRTLTYGRRQPMLVRPACVPAPTPAPDPA